MSNDITASRSSLWSKGFSSLNISNFILPFIFQSMHREIFPTKEAPIKAMSQRIEYQYFQQIPIRTSFIATGNKMNSKTIIHTINFQESRNLSKTLFIVFILYLTFCCELLSGLYSSKYAPEQSWQRPPHR